MLTLYYKPTCAYSAEVIAHAEAMGLQIDLKDVSFDAVLRDELIARGGKKQTPYLVDTERGAEMYESNDIISHLRTHYDRTGDSAPRSFNGLRVHRNDVSCDTCE